MLIGLDTQSTEYAIRNNVKMEVYKKLFSDNPPKVGEVLSHEVFDQTAIRARSSKCHLMVYSKSECAEGYVLVQCDEDGKTNEISNWSASAYIKDVGRVGLAGRNGKYTPVCDDVLAKSIAILMV